MTVTVVMATRNRHEMLDRALTALERQTHPPAQIVVVDDGSTDDTAAVLARHGIEHLRTDGVGPARARNLGIAESTGTIVAFTDDDCVPSPEWLEHLTPPIASGDVEFSQGRTLPDPNDSALAGPWSHTMNVEEHTQNYPTCNMAYRRALLDRLGGFDESFPSAAGEDTDLAWRALELGARVRFVPDAVVHHAVWPSSFLEHLRRIPRWQSIPQLIARHPDARALLHSRLVWRATHTRVMRLGAVLVLLMIVHPLLGVAAAGVFSGRKAFVARREQLPLVQTVVTAFLRLGADAFEVGVLVVGSIRHRTLVL